MRTRRSKPSAEPGARRVTEGETVRKCNRRTALRSVGLAALVVVIFFGVAVPVMVFLSVRHDNFTKTDLRDYTEFLQTDSVMPHTDALGDYAALHYKHTRRSSLIFTSDAYLLVASYDAQEFARRQAAVDAAYRFEPQAVTNYKGTFDVRFTVDGFDFRVLSMDAYHSDMPGDFYCIGVNAQTGSIAYLYYKDSDLDTIPSYADFLRNECGWPITEE